MSVPGSDCGEQSTISPAAIWLSNEAIRSAGGVSPTAVADRQPRVITR
jgi:hypothetical protein